MAVDLNTLKSLGLTEKAAEAKKRNQLSQDDFMKLMVAQLKHQDPSKPQDATAFVNQMAQFAMVSGMQTLNKTLDNFVGTNTKNQALTAANLVGRSVLIKSDQASLSTGHPVQGELVIPNDASEIRLRVSDQNGRTVWSQELGPQSAGTRDFSWNGKASDGSQAAEGTYKVVAEAVMNGKTTALETHVAAPVESVTLGGATGSMEVQLGGFLGRHSLSDVLAVM